MSPGSEKGKRPPITLTPGSQVRVYSAGPQDKNLVSTGSYRGLVTIAGDTVLAIELDGPGEEKGRTRLVSMSALVAIDILRSATPDEEPRTEKQPATPAYFG